MQNKKRNTNGNGKRKPANKKGGAKNNQSFHSNAHKPAVEVHEITYADGITVGELAEKCGKQASDIIKSLFMEGKMVKYCKVSMPRSR